MKSFSVQFSIKSSDDFAEIRFERQTIFTDIVKRGEEDLCFRIYAKLLAMENDQIDDKSDCDAQKSLEQSLNVAENCHVNSSELNPLKWDEHVINCFVIWFYAHRLWGLLVKYWEQIVKPEFYDIQRFMHFRASRFQKRQSKLNALNFLWLG